MLFLETEIDPEHAHVVPWPDSGLVAYMWVWAFSSYMGSAGTWKEGVTRGIQSQAATPEHHGQWYRPGSSHLVAVGASERSHIN